MPIKMGIQQVAWMERSGIQELLTLDYATLHPGYAPDAGNFSGCRNAH